MNSEFPIDDSRITYVILYGNQDKENSIIVLADSYSKAESYALECCKKLEQNETNYWLIDVYDPTNEGHIDLLEKQKGRLWEI